MPQPPALPVAAGPPQIIRTGSRATPLLLGLIALLLAGLIGCMVIEIQTAQQSRDAARQSLALATKSHLSPDTRTAVQAAYDTSNKVLGTIEGDFSKTVFNTSSIDRAPKQQVAEGQYLFEMQVLIAQQNKAMLKALLDS
jgi:hypothetical protein